MLVIFFPPCWTLGKITGCAKIPTEVEVGWSGPEHAGHLNLKVEKCRHSRGTTKFTHRWFPVVFQRRIKVADSWCWPVPVSRHRSRGRNFKRWSNSFIFSIHNRFSSSFLGGLQLNPTTNMAAQIVCDFLRVSRDFHTKNDSGQLAFAH
jgi:hypothetical protein